MDGAQARLEPARPGNAERAPAGATDSMQSDAAVARMVDGMEEGVRLRHLHPVPPVEAAAVAVTVTVAVISPYPTVRAGLRVLLEADPHVDVIAESATVAGLAGVAPADALAVLVLDPAGSAMPPLATGTLPGATGVVFLGPPPGGAAALDALGERAWAYLPPDADGAELAAAVLAVHAGLLAIHPSLAAQLLGGNGVLPRGASPEDDGTVEELTPRELEVLALLAEGIPNKVIARRLGISDHTVKFHVGALLGKLNAGSRTEAVRIGVRRGLIAL